MLRRVILNTIPFPQVRTTIDLFNVGSNGLSIRKIEGLGPPAYSLSLSSNPFVPGSTYNHTKVPSRNIVITFGLDWGPTVEDARQLLYRQFPHDTKIYIGFVTDNRSVVIEGYVEKVEPDIFSPNSSMVVSIICLNPWFLGATVSSSGVTVTPKLNTVLMERLPTTFESIIEYNGDVIAPVNRWRYQPKVAGVTEAIFALNSSLTVQASKLESGRTDFGVDSTSDLISVPGQKAFKWDDNTAITRNKLMGIKNFSTATWPYLRRGNNTAKLTQKGAATVINAVSEIQYYEMFQGV